MSFVTKNSIKESSLKVRYKWMDSLRGLAIVLVVHFHVVDSLFAEYPNLPSFIEELTIRIAPLRMPILVFLSGLLVSNSLSKGYIRYFSGKIKNILYPYLLWTIILFIMVIVRDFNTEGEPSYSLIQSIITTPLYHLWFLYYLFFYYLITYFLSNRGIFITAIVVIMIYLINYEPAYQRFL